MGIYNRTQMPQRFFGQRRPTFLGLDDLTPSQDMQTQDAAADGTATGAPASVTVPVPAAAPEPDYTDLTPDPTTPAADPYEKPSKTKLAIAQSLLAHSDEASPVGSGWLGGIDRVLSGVGGAWAANKAEEEQLANERKQSETLFSSLGEGGDADEASMRYAKALAITDPKAAQAFLQNILKARETARIAAANKGPTYRVRSAGGIDHQEQSFDNGKTWSEYGSKDQFKPADPETEISDVDAQYLGKQLARSGDASVLLRQGFHNASKIRHFATQDLIDRNVDPVEAAAIVAEFGAVKSSQVAFGKREANIQSVLAEGKAAAKVAKESSLRYQRGQFVPLNSLLNGFEVATSNPDLAKFAFDATELAGAAASIAARGGTNQYLQHHFITLLSTATSHRAFAAMADEVVKNGENLAKYSEEARKGMLASFMTGKITRVPPPRPGEEFKEEASAGVAPGGSAQVGSAPAAKPKPKVGDTRPDPKDPKKTRIFDGTHWIIKK